MYRDVPSSVGCPNYLATQFNPAFNPVHDGAIAAPSDVHTCIRSSVHPVPIVLGLTNVPLRT